MFTDAELAEKDEDISSEGLGKDCIQERVGTGVKRVEEHQKYLRVGYRDERLVHYGRQSIEGNWRHAEEVCEDENRHTLCNFRVFVSRFVVGVSYSDIDLDVASTDYNERYDVEH